MKQLFLVFSFLSLSSISFARAIVDADVKLSVEKASKLRSEAPITLLLFLTDANQKETLLAKLHAYKDIRVQDIQSVPAVAIEN